MRRAGLTAEGVDLSAFALIRSLYRPDPEQTGRVLYLNVDGLTNLAIAEGTVCRFTRVVGSGLEGMASELAERRSIALTEARALLAAVDLNAPAPVEQDTSLPEETDPEAAAEEPEAGGGAEEPEGERAPGESGQPQSREEADENELAMSYEELAAVESGPEPQAPRSDTDRRGWCSRTAFARSPGRFATRSTSTAPRRAEARSHTS